MFYNGVFYYIYILFYVFIFLFFYFFKGGMGVVIGLLLFWGFFCDGFGFLGVFCLFVFCLGVFGFCL